MLLSNIPCLKSQRRLTSNSFTHVNAEYVQSATSLLSYEVVKPAVFLFSIQPKKKLRFVAIAHEGGGNGREVINLTGNIADEIKMKERISA